MGRYDAGRCLLSDFRKKRGLTQKQLSELTKISRTHISALERNIYPITISQGKSLSVILKCHIEELYEWIEISE